MANVVMNRRLRPIASESRPKTNAPNTSPARYTVATAPTAVEERSSAAGVLSTPATELATVISRPSKIQATPSATTILV
jgi:hypothetical protein